MLCNSLVLLYIFIGRTGMKGLTITVFLSTRSAPFFPSTLSVQSIIFQSLEYFINVLPFVPIVFLERDRMEIIFQKLKIKEVKCHPKSHRYFGQPTVRETSSAGIARDHLRTPRTNKKESHSKFLKSVI